jgi:ABC-type polysaccharide transport system permease subunit
MNDVLQGVSILNKPMKSALAGRASLLCMTVPFFILIVIFSYVPLWGWSIAFIDYSPGIPILESGFAGLKYFFRIFGSTSEFLMVMRNTLVLSGLNMLVSPLIVILAVMLNEVRSSPVKRVVQTVSSFPNFVSWVIVYSLFFSMLSVEDGVVNNALLKLGLMSQPVDFLGTPQSAWMLQTFATFWKNAGWNAIIYIAAIANIDIELYDAAEIDGAGRLDRIWHITVPGILPTFFVLFILGIGNLLSAGGFEQYFIFHNALVHDYIEVLDTYTYRVGMQVNDFPLATAAGIFKTLVSIVLLIFANKLHKKTMGYPII